MTVTQTMAVIMPTGTADGVFASSAPRAMASYLRVQARVFAHNAQKPA